jgi:hypothetical protein
MELNCTHEESKKILELGYDFSSVCDRFIEELTRLKKPEYIEREYFDIVVFRSEVDQHIKDSWIPIVPKAALETCLLIDLPPESEYDYRYFEKCCGGDVIELEGKSKSIKFNSAFEAFIWCQEKYPEELRAKFEEVMK